MMQCGKKLIISFFFIFFLLINIEAAEMSAVLEKASQKQDSGESDQSRVEIRRNVNGFQLYRNGRPYYIKGVGGDRFIDAARAAGANSIRTWNSHNIGELLDRAQAHGMTVLLGIWLSHRPSDYLNENYKNRIIAEVRSLLNRYKDHHALLMWSLGNEINLLGKDSSEAWRFINTLTRMIQQQDGRHPVITAVAFSGETLNNITRYAPDLDAVGINAYSAIAGVRAMVDASEYTGPYLITEWGGRGHWEVKQTRWARPIEPVSHIKAELCRRNYIQDIVKNSDRCLGSYLFFWGQKQERTPTWYSLFIEAIPGTGLGALAGATVDVMTHNWSGSWPINRTPMVTGMTINGATAYDNVTINPCEPMLARVAAHDPEKERLTYIWEILEEPVELSLGGAWEQRPPTVGRVIVTQIPEIKIHSPDDAGDYRLLVYAIDGHGRAGTANIPFQVKAYRTRKE